jgi:hypothetical protein
MRLLGEVIPSPFPGFSHKQKHNKILFCRRYGNCMQQDIPGKYTARNYFSRTQGLHQLLFK